MSFATLLKWPDLDRSVYAKRVGVLILLYSVAYGAAIFFSVCLGRSFKDSGMILTGTIFYDVCVGIIFLVFRSRTMLTFATIALIFTVALRFIGLMPYYTETSTAAIVENVVMHASFALISAAIAFPLTSYLFRSPIK